MSLIALKFQLERRHEYCGFSESEWARGYRACLKRIIEDIDRMLTPAQEVQDGKGHSRFDRPICGLSDERESNHVVMPVAGD